MSHQAERWAKRQRGIPTGARFVLRCIADAHNGQTGRCDPSVARLMDETGYSADAIGRHIRALEDAGLVTAERMVGQRTRYILHAEEASDPPQNADTHPPQNADTHPPQNAGGGARSEAGDHPQNAGGLPAKCGDHPPQNAGRTRESNKGTNQGIEVGKVAPYPSQSHRAHARDAPAARGLGLFDDPPPTPEPATTGNVVALRPRQGIAVREPAGFEEFWTAYPRKTAKGDARKSWLKAITKHPPAAIIAALRERVPHFSAEPRFVPHPATWLNQERWADEIASLRAVATSRPISAAEESMRALGITPEEAARLLGEPIRVQQ